MASSGGLSVLQATSWTNMVVFDAWYLKILIILECCATMEGNDLPFMFLCKYQSCGPDLT